ncbi:src homology 2 domain containing transforming protein D, b isoform 3-T3 [Spinachia spinachia]
MGSEPIAKLCVSVCVCDHMAACVAVLVPADHCLSPVRPARSSLSAFPPPRPINHRTVSGCRRNCDHKLATLSFSRVLRGNHAGWPERIHLARVVPSAPLAGDTDYSDPFDARVDRRSEPDRRPVPHESNGYMEPYEAQRLITELQRGPGGGRSRGGVQLYDTPYEDARGQRPGPLHGQPQEESGRLPQDDERPADEYDQPWEWKRDHISKAFAEMRDLSELPWPAPVGQLEEEPPVREPVQTDGSSPPTERLRPTGPRSSPLAGGGVKFRMAQEGLSLVGERVDPTLPLEKQVWYHGSLSRSEAESLLTLCKECSYLVRTSQTNRSDYSLSLRSCQGFMHMKVTQYKDGRYVLGQNSPPFDTIPEVIHFYTTHKLPIRGAEHLSLLFPVLVQTL